MDISAIHLVKVNDVEDNSPLLLDAFEMYLKTKGKIDKTLIRTARRNAAYMAKLPAHRPISPRLQRSDEELKINPSA